MSPYDDSIALARALLGATLLVDGVGGIVVETEAYDADDPASHSFGGRTDRNAAMFGPAGRAYVYRSYGIHWCFNVTCGPVDHGAAVLIRALQPTLGVDRMKERRGLDELKLLCAGPGRLCQALGITRVHDGLDVEAPPFALHWPDRVPTIVAGPRIGITKAADRPWRFAIAGSPWLSRPMAGGAPA